jgi:hypothetical protein
VAETWINQTEIKSASSSRIYIVSEKVSNGMPTGTWGCSCPGWKSHGKCKHLAAMGLRSAREPHASIAAYPRAPAKRNSFSDSAYNHYDTSNGFGSAYEWIRQAEQHAYGRGRYQPPPRQRFTPNSQADDLKLLSLTAMPDEAKGLVKAMRKQAMIDHPDHESGDQKRFIAMIEAYERLLKYY